MQHSPSVQYSETGQQCHHTLVLAVAAASYELLSESRTSGNHIILPVGTNPVLHLKSISVPPSVLGTATMEPLPGKVGNPQLTGRKGNDNRAIKLGNKKLIVTAFTIMEWKEKL